MKHFNNIKSKIRNVDALAVIYPLLLIIPNVLLDITESMTAMNRAVNILLPLSVYLLAMAVWKKIGWTIVLLLPVTVLAAFQLVLLYLYKESIIAVDMFLNVVTTSMSEATELLSNLSVAIIGILILYLPALSWGVYAIVKKRHTSTKCRRRLGIAGGIMMGGAIILLAISYSTDRYFKIKHDIFPANVIYNIKVATDRVHEKNHYGETSSPFRYNAVSSHNPQSREIYVLVVGETSRSENWQLNGYRRETNPLLSKRNSVNYYKKALSQSNTTHKSVPMLLSTVSAIDFDSICRHKSIITAFKEAGFHTTFLSNQSPNGSYTEFFGNEADNTRYVPMTGKTRPADGVLIDLVRQQIADTTLTRQLIVLHTYGSHFNYKERYPAEFAYFLPDNATDANRLHRDELINAYDNSIRYTDYVLDCIIEMLDRSGSACALLYASDHGEDIFDDSRERFLHASPTPTYHQLHVAMLSWLSDSYAILYPHIKSNLALNADKYVSSTLSLPNTMLDIAGIDTPYLKKHFSLANDLYTSPLPMYLNDLNYPVMMRDAGLKDSDITKLKELQVL